MYPRKDQCNYRSVTQPPFDMKIKYYFLFWLVFSGCWWLSSVTRIEKEGLTERAIILCKPSRSLLESSISVGIHRQKSLYYLMNLCI